MSPFYDRLPGVGGFGVERNLDLLGAALAVGATAGVAAHAVATGVHQIRSRRAAALPAVDGQPPAGPSAGGGEGARRG
jgi:hypothetical protein